MSRWHLITSSWSLSKQMCQGCLQTIEKCVHRKNQATREGHTEHPYQSTEKGDDTEHYKMKDRIQKEYKRSIKLVFNLNSMPETRLLPSIH